MVCCPTPSGMARRGRTCIMGSVPLELAGDCGAPWHRTTWHGPDNRTQTRRAGTDPTQDGPDPPSIFAPLQPLRIWVFTLVWRSRRTKAAYRSRLTARDGRKRLTARVWHFSSAGGSSVLVRSRGWPRREHPPYACVWFRHSGTDSSRRGRHSTLLHTGIAAQAPVSPHLFSSLTPTYT